MEKARRRHRILLQLDPRPALEAIILNRIERVPKARQEWLRGLLVQGFRLECQAQREAAGLTPSRRAMPFYDWLTGEPTRQAASTALNRAQRLLAVTAPPATPQATKPFAQLRRIIG